MLRHAPNSVNISQYKGNLQQIRLITYAGSVLRDINNFELLYLRSSALCSQRLPFCHSCINGSATEGSSNFKKVMHLLVVVKIRFRVQRKITSGNRGQNTHKNLSPIFMILQIKNHLYVKLNFDYAIISKIFYVAISIKQRYHI